MSPRQTRWLVSRAGHCEHLVEHLDVAPLLGKKAGEYAIWRRAVRAWRSSRSDRWARLEALAAEVRAHRSSDFTPDYTVDITQPELEAFLAGFATGEARFGATVEGWPRFVINLRRDDQALLAYLRSRFELGRLVSLPPAPPTKPGISWRVTRIADLLELTEIFDRHAIQGRQARVYSIWRDLILLRARGVGGETARELSKAIRRAREYRPPSVRASRQAATTGRRRCLHALSTWAAQLEPPFTATRYESFRRSSSRRWPNRDTIVRHFGSWRAALQACGLSTQGTRSAVTLTRIKTAQAPAHKKRRDMRRDEIIAAIRRCEASFGRPASATEFFRWRLAEAPESPSQATLYNCFPGGWLEAVEAVAEE